MMIILLSFWSLCSVASAFASRSHPLLPHHILQDRRKTSAWSATTSTTTTKTITTQLRAGGRGDDFSELTSALARLDQQWQIRERSKIKSRWSKVFLPPVDDDEDGTTTTPITEGLDKNEDFVWILEPPSNSIPSCMIVFTGGAGLGQFPHIAYNELLSKISNRLNAVCIAAPYQVGLDHFSLAKSTGEKIRRALVYCEDDPSRLYPPNLPTYSLGHSLGCKLQTIYLAATGQQFEGIGFMSFNNFSFGQTITMARSFADQLRRNDKKNGNPPGETDEILNTIFGFAETIVGAIGVDFTPNAKDTERLIQLRFDDILQKKTRLFVFDEDTLDNSQEFVNNCSGGSGPSISGLPGGHLASVYFKFGFDDLDLDDIPPEAVDMAKEAVGGFQSASFGNEDHLNELVREVSEWIMGKPPRRGSQWGRSSSTGTGNGPQRLAGYIDADVEK